MIKKIHFNHYRKLKDLDIEFTKNVNIISGTNGTCKTSILHLCSNAFQAPKKNFIEDKKVITTINNINMLTNPKVETLTKGDKKYNDPAPGHKGQLFNITYFDNSNQDFRRHNINEELNKKKRYRVILKYPQGQRESLKTLITIYLGLPRLFPFGEIDDKEKTNNSIKIRNIANTLPEEYKNELYNLYKELTGISIAQTRNTKIENIKIRAEFETDIEGIDSNTISAGEDNIMVILTALISLKYYYEKANIDNDIVSLLLIDELDATLHPEMQIKIFNKILEYSEKYKIQVIFTSHSFTLIEHAKKCKQNLIYIQNRRTIAKLMDTPDIYKIKMNLYNNTSINLFKNSKIPVLTEDKEARFVLKIFLDKYNRCNLNELFHLVDANMGNTCIKQILTDEYMYKNTIGLIAILDGDCRTEENDFDNNESKNYFNHNIMWLPGKESPEILFFKYALDVYNDENSVFHNYDEVQNKGYTHNFFDSNIKPIIDECLQIEKAKDKRKQAKKIFNDFIEFFKFIINHWVKDENNAQELNRFYSTLKNLYKKNADVNNCNPNAWI